jgi:hypothetical protein
MYMNLDYKIQISVIVKGAVLCVFIVAYIYLNKSVPFLMAGVDQVLHPWFLHIFRLLIYFSVSSYLIFFFTYAKDSRYKVLISASALILSLLNALISIYVSKIDQHDMYLHVNSQRMWVNILIFLMLLIMIAQSRTSGEQK